jgi:small-conductance mechanosensitive channel
LPQSQQPQQPQQSQQLLKKLQDKNASLEQLVNKQRKITGELEKQIKTLSADIAKMKIITNKLLGSAHNFNFSIG